MPEQERVNQLAREFLLAESTMTLATAKDGQAWAAPVYYVLHQGGFFFLSSPDSRHSLEAMESGQASAAVSAHVSSWRDIKGVQMSGRVLRIPVGITAARAMKAYLGKYPFVKEFFEKGQAMDLAGFFKRFKVHLFKFQPDVVYYLDNGIEFGFKERVSL